MSNSYFQFKDFLVEQDLSAMKVCTDSCLFGAWVANYGQKNVNKILDIGSGTGLLSLMLAQQYQTIPIDAVEIEKQSAQQTCTNFEKSPYSSRFKIYNTSIQDFAAVSQSRYELIVCNPPFYSQHLLSSDILKNKAKHNDCLPPDELSAAIEQLLAPEGEFWLLLPPNELGKYEVAFKAYQILVSQQIHVSNQQHLSPIRHILCFQRKDISNPTVSKIFIRNNDHTYSEVFSNLLKNYYLHL